MFFIVHKYLRRTALATMLLVAACANCFCVSYDANDDDDVPPVTIELKFVSPAGRSVGSRQAQSTESSKSAQPLTSHSLLIAGHDQQRAGALHDEAPQIVVPLRR
jgi:hypothetical protein